MKLCIDAGHGQDNRKTGRYDPGACHGAIQEATIALNWAHALQQACVGRGISVFMTRATALESAPLARRATKAVQAGCTHLISLHINDADGTPEGFETLYRTTRSRSFAIIMHHTVRGMIKLKDRGVKPRPDLGVIGNCALDSCLLELGFISNAKDMAVIQDRETMTKTCEYLAAQLAAWRDAHR